MNIKVLIVTSSLLALVGCSPDLKSDEGRFSYAVGYEIGKSMKRQGVDLDKSTYQAAMDDALKGKKSKLNEEERRKAMQAMSEVQRKKEKEKAEKNKNASKEFLEANKKKEGVKTTASGLQYQVIKPGSGRKPRKNSKVKVHYEGTLTDGTKFDSSYDRGQPAEFPLNAVIKGWTEGLQLMKTGAKYKFFIPPALGYGDRSSPKIPGNSVLVFKVELLDILKNKKSKKRKK